MKKIDWPNHLMEFVTVVIGILLAFSLNNWNENQKEKELAEQYLSGIQAELEDNLAEVEEKLEYHNGLLQQLQEKPEEVRLIIRSSDVKNFAWEMADGNALKKHTAYDLYLNLLEIYQMQEKLKKHGEDAASMMAQLNTMSPLYMLSARRENFEEMGFKKMSREGWIPIFQDMTTYERELAEMYRKALAGM